MIISNGKQHTDGNHEVNCPHCGSNYTSTHDVHVNNNGVVIDFSCTNCQEEFQMRIAQRKSNTIVGILTDK
ncbi:DpnI domain-containing protein [Yersinia pseudotuberculosis]|uniref:Uncharacterized protein n=1 Tax=Yersinia pseudotuberculosis serotype O:3 (strain YPIII) TaxID=502800 RepID=A0A0H3B2X1_YERPY|nr:DpnI domain-containing protein [Yersinia pseudotuberculosis]AJJ59387.1 dam-replacing family protein [Yersinia pseudotuberculosis YPIII]AYW87257.1 hypothetical protein EGX87_08705 [Yersinia pseudotuberculosis]